jgi:dolichyl-phosphate beta-glucosyltransferase
MEKVKRKISVIIPCYNEALIISDTVKKIDKYLSLRKFNYEIILVNDGSTDNTLDIILSLSHRYNHLYFFTSQTNRGKGYAVRQGLLMARHRIKLVLDADLSVDITAIHTLDIQMNLPFSIIKGQRHQLIRQPLYRIFAGKMFKVLVWLFTGMYLDSQCPFFLTTLPKEFFKDLKIDGFAFDVEILYKAKLQNIRIDKIEVSYVNDENSSVRIKHWFLMFKELLEIRKKK